MALDSRKEDGDSLHEVRIGEGSRFAHDFYERDTGRSNFTAFLLGGVVVAGGLLGFLYYDTDNLSQRDGLTTGSIGQVESPASVPMLKLQGETAPTPAPPTR